VIASKSREHLENLIPKLEIFLKEKLKLSLHEQKVIIRKYIQGVDFLGHILLPHYILPQTKTKRRIFKKLRSKIEELKNGDFPRKSFNQSLQSYLGYLSHANSYKLTQNLKNQILFWQDE